MPPGSASATRCAALHPARGQPRGEFVGEAIGLGIRQLAAGMHQRDPLAEACRCLPQRATEDAHVRNLQRRCSRRAAMVVARAARLDPRNVSTHSRIELGQLDDPRLRLWVPQRSARHTRSVSNPSGRPSVSSQFATPGSARRGDDRHHAVRAGLGLLVVQAGLAAHVERLEPAELVELRAPVRGIGLGERARPAPRPAAGPRSRSVGHRLQARAAPCAAG